MKPYFLYLLFLVSSLAVYGHEPDYRFIENQGQWPSEVWSRVDVQGGHLYLTKSGLVINLWDKGFDHASPTAMEDAVPAKAHAVRLSFKKATSARAKMTGIGPYSTRYSFFLGNDRSKWASDVRAYEEQMIENLFDGVDWHFHQGEELKYDFIVKPGGDVGDLVFAYEGADSVYLDGENLWVTTSVGDIIEKKPVAFQIIEGKKVDVPARYQLDRSADGTTWISYRFPDGYDASASLVIDPELIFSTYSGSTADNWGNSATYDDQANLYSAGTVDAIGFPLSVGSYDSTFGLGDCDIGLLKFDSTGTELLAATYLGGGGSEVAHSLLVDFDGNLLILGSTSSDNFPVSTSAFDKTFAGGYTAVPMSGRIYMGGSDIFVAKLDSDLTDLLASTYLGGDGNDGLNTAEDFVLNRNYGDELRGDILMDSANNVYITCVTQSDDFPTTVGAYDRSLGGNQDGVVCKLMPDLDSLIWSTYLGGSQLEAAYTLKLTPIGNIVIGGGTNSDNFPATDSTIHTGFQGGSTDGFLAVLAPDGDSLVAATYLGTSGYDQVYLIDVDFSDSTVAVFGQTLGDYLVTSGVYSNVGGKQFVHKMSLDLRSTDFSTVVGSGVGSEIDIVPTAFLVSSCSNIFLSGWGGVVNAPRGFSTDTLTDRSGYLGGNTRSLTTTGSALQTSSNGSDFYFMVLSSDGAERLFATFMGSPSATRGDHVDGGTSRFDKRGVIYQAVCSCSGNASPFPVYPNPGAYSTLNRSDNCNNLAIKYDLAILLARMVTSSTDSLVSGRAGCDPYPVKFENLSNGGQEYRWDLGDGTAFTVENQNPFVHLYDTTGDFIVSMTAVDQSTCAQQITVYDTVTVYPTGFEVSDSSVICRGDQTVVFANSEANATYRWIPAIGLEKPNQKSSVAAPDSTQNYQVIITTTDGCTDTLATQVRIVQPIEADFEVETAVSCDTIMAVIFTNKSVNAASYEWDFGDGQTSTEQDPIVYYGKEGRYLITMIARDGPCFNDVSDEIFAPIDNGYLDFLGQIGVSDDRTICLGDTTQIFAFGASGYTWMPTHSLNDHLVENPLAFPDTSTLYTVQLLYRDSCSIDSMVMVEVIPRVDAGLTWSTESECGIAAPILLKDLTLNASSYYIDFGDGNTYSGLEVPKAYTYASSGVYDVRVIGINDHCSDTLDLQIVSEFINPPNVFTPNNDGFNPTFDIGVESNKWSLKVYNRWGKEVYFSDEYQNDWDGGDLGNGTYYYRLSTGNGSNCKGWLTIFR